MKVKKIGHCCLVIEVNDMKIMTDPGNHTTKQTEEKDVDFILITHEHFDHVHTESLKEVIKNNPNVQIITNSAVAELLRNEGIVSTVFEDGEQKFFAHGGDVTYLNLFARTGPHADIYDGIPIALNTGYMINDILFYPGDAWLEIYRPVHVLAVPVAGPWHKMRDMMNYVEKVKPKVVFNVHDGMLNDIVKETFPALVKRIFASKGYDFRFMRNGDIQEFNN